jgi:hypothetical protein
VSHTGDTDRWQKAKQGKAPRPGLWYVCLLTGLFPVRITADESEGTNSSPSYQCRQDPGESNHATVALPARRYHPFHTGIISHIPLYDGRPGVNPFMLQSSHRAPLGIFTEHL